MADQYIQQLSATASVLAAYLVPISDDPSGTSRLKKATFTQIVNFLSDNAFSSIGIGITPAAKLHVIGTTEQLRVGYDGSNYYSTTVSSAGAVTFDAVGSSSSFIFSDTVNVNATNPHLDINATGTYGYLVITNSGGSTKNGTWVQNASGEMYWYSQVHAWTDYSGATEKMRLNTSGNLGVGTSSPLGKLDARATTGAQIVGSYDSSNYWTATTSSTGVTTLNAVGSGSSFIFTDRVTVSGGSAIMRLDSASATDARFEFLYNASRNGYLNVDSGIFTLFADSGVKLTLAAASNVYVTSGSFVVGHSSTALGKLESRATSGAQIVGSYDASNYWNVTTESTGLTTFSTSSGDFTFTPYASKSVIVNTSSTGTLRVNGVYGLSGGFINYVVAKFWSTNTAAVDTGAVIGLGGKTGNSTADYNFAFIRGAKESATASNYAGYLAFHTVSGGDGGRTNSGEYEWMRITSAGLIGFGTTSPSARVHSISTTEQVRVGYDTSNYYSTTVSSAGVVTFDAVGSGSKFIFNDNVGVGVTPLAKLDVAETIRISRVTSGNNCDLDYYNNNTTAGVVARIRMDGDNISNLYGALSFHTTRTPDTLVERMRITSAGLVGIGTSSPASLFTVNQAANSTDGTQATYGIRLDNQTVCNFTVGSDASYVYLQSWANKPFVVNSQGNNTILNPTSGSVGIGVISSISAKCHIISTTEQLRVGYDASNYWNATTSSAGAITFDAVGASAGFTFSDALSCSSSILSSSASGGVGYKTGAGGAVTQTTSKSTSVTLNKVCGQITTHTETMAYDALRIFTVYNSTVSAYDTIAISLAGGQAYTGSKAWVATVAAGEFSIVLHNAGSGGSGTDSGAWKINFAVIKAVNS